MIWRVKRKVGYLTFHKPFTDVNEYMNTNFSDINECIYTTLLKSLPWKYPFPIQGCPRGGLKNGIIRNENEHHHDPDQVPREEETIVGGFQLFRKNITHFFQTFNRKKWHEKYFSTLL